MFPMNRVLACLALTMTGSLTCAVAADPFPAKPFTIVVPYAVGGGTDALARQIGAELQKMWGQSVVVDNRVGASGNVGARAILNGPADAHTMMFVNSTYAINPGVFRNLPFDPKKDFTPVINVAWVPSVFVVPPDSPFKSLGDVLAAAAPGKGGVPFGSCGNGTPQHMAGELINMRAKVELTQIPYRGCGPAVVDVLAKQIPLAMVAASAAAAHVKSGKLRALAVTSKERSPLMPDVPTAGESALPGYELDQWHGFLIPSTAPKAVVDKINADVKAIVTRPEFIEKMMQAVYTPTASTPEAFRKIVEDDIDRFTEISAKAGIKAE